MYTPVSPSVSEMEDIDATGMWGGDPFGRMYIWWNLFSFNLLACYARVTVGDSVVVSLVCRALLLRFVC